MINKAIAIALTLCFLTGLASPQQSSNALNVRWNTSIGAPSKEIKSNIIDITASDINRDQHEEIVVVSGGSITSTLAPTNNFVYVYARDGTLMWVKGIDDEIKSAYVKDVDRDGFQEIIIGSGQMMQEISRGRIYVMRSTGEISMTHHSTTIINNLFVTDLDGDKLDDFIGGSSKQVKVFDAYGLRKWDYLVGDEVTTVAAADVMEDDSKEVLVGSKNFYLLNGLGVKEFSFNVENETGKINDEVDTITVANLTDYHYASILITTKKDEKVYAYRSEYNRSLGTYVMALRWSRQLGGKVTAIKAVNLDQDNMDEVLVGSDEDYLTALDGDGTVLWTFKANSDIMDVDVEDLNNDEREEVVFGTLYGTIYVLSKRGEFMWRYDLDDPINRLEVADLDKDPYREIIVGTMRRMLYVFELNQTFTDLQMAEDLYIKAQELYVISEYELARQNLEHALSLFTKVEEATGIKKTENMLRDIEDKFSGLKKQNADTAYEKSQEYFISQEYELSRKYGLEAKSLYEELKDTQGLLKTELLLLRIDKVLGRVVEESTTTYLTTTTVPQEKYGKGNPFLTLGLAVIVLVVGLIVKGRRKPAETLDEKYMTEYEKDLEKVIEEDLYDLGKEDLDKMGGGGENTP